MIREKCEEIEKLVAALGKEMKTKVIVDLYEFIYIN